MKVLIIHGYLLVSYILIVPWLLSSSEESLVFIGMLLASLGIPIGAFVLAKKFFNFM
ncbi:hypothetical protein vBYenM21017_007 [Yersinia phage vB_YenM_210.17]|nr:hypothetical protein vBYenM2918_007 [Yersinia phage vB_YenM_29.18]UNA05775.1 hypothetical protein vBYenM21017_007 [Yersinia phage vB_YenM_210.17]CNG24537.1 Uncharacterised protein [Yersinia enterocolitica]